MVEKKYTIPDRENLHNYLLDTSVYNHIAENSELLNLMKTSLLIGFRYYSTKIQDMELAGYGAKVYGKDGIPNLKYHMTLEEIEKFNKIDEQLNIGLVYEVAVLMKNHMRADGTLRFIDPDSVEGQLFDEIVSKNNKDSNTPCAYSHDAIIAEAAIHYGCVLVTDDIKLKKLVGVHFPGCAISTEELGEIIKNIINELNC